MLNLSDLLTCGRCPLSQKCTPVIPIAAPNAKILIIGDKPTKEDDLYGRPFTSREGDILQKILVKAGYQHGEAYLTYAVKCHSDKNPTKAQASACSYWIQQEIISTLPKIKIILGKSAWSRLLSTPAPEVGMEANGFHLWESTTVLLNSGVKMFNNSVNFFKQMKEKANGIS